MAKAHSFFIPEMEYLVDVRGLIKFLGEKVTVTNVCLFCNGRGRGMYSTEAVRNHMVLSVINSRSIKDMLKLLMKMKMM